MGVPHLRQFEQSQSELGYHLDAAKEYLGVCPDCILTTAAGATLQTTR